MNRKAVISLSGGLDSTTLLAFLLEEGWDVHAIGFAYGAKHGSYENEAACEIAAFYDVPFQFFDLEPVIGQFDSDLLKSGGPIPEGNYTDTSMESTVVPGRNMIFLTIAAGVAWSVKASHIAIGIHQGDHAIYADCRPEFFKAMDAAIFLGTDKRVEILAPFVNMNKAQIVSDGLGLGVPYRLTRTCYKDQELACGKCGSCRERLEAFAMNTCTDPITYEGK